MTTKNEIKPSAPAEASDGGRCAVDALFGPPSDTDMLNWLAQRCYLPGDHPDDGILVVVSTRFSPLGEFSCNEENDNAALRRAVARAMRGQNTQGQTPEGAARRLSEATGSALEKL